MKILQIHQKKVYLQYGKLGRNGEVVQQLHIIELLISP